MQMDVSIAHTLRRKGSLRLQLEDRRGQDSLFRSGVQ
jgi:hypothetical protein